MPVETGLRHWSIRSPLRWVAAVSLVMAVAYLILVPPVPDLAAQTARANVVRLYGNVVWWTGWFGGVHTPTYSELGPLLMALIGAPAAGALAAVLASLSMARLLRRSHRPLAGSLAFAAASFIDLFDGRVTFALGLALALACLVLLESRRSYLAAGVSVLTTLVSPLAALFVGLAAGAVIVTVPSRRRPAAMVAGAAAATAAVLAVWFPGTGQMPYTAQDMWPTLAAAVVVAILCRRRPVIVLGALLAGAAAVVLLVQPGAVGSNITRLASICAAPVVVAWAPGRRWVVALVAAALAVGPISDLVGQLAASRDPSAQPTFYQPLLSALKTSMQSAGQSATGERVEVVDPRTHWSAAYIAPQVPLARGWDRQADVANDRLFYHGALTAQTYREWLDSLAVGWVAVPHTVLDYAAKAEAALIHRGLGYLRPVWANPSWTLYRVEDAKPLAQGAVVTAMTADHIQLRVAHPGPVRLRLRWSPYLSIHTLDDTAVGGACVSDDQGWVRIVTQAAGDYTISAHFDPTDYRVNNACTSNAHASGADGRAVGRLR